MKSEKLIWRLLQQFRQDVVWFQPLWGWQNWLDSECILRVESTEFADGLDMDSEKGKERRGNLDLNCWQDLLLFTEMRKSKKAVPCLWLNHICVIVLQTKSVVFWDSIMIHKRTFGKYSDFEANKL